MDLLATSVKLLLTPELAHLELVESFTPMHCRQTFKLNLEKVNLTKYVKSIIFNIPE